MNKMKIFILALSLAPLYQCKDEMDPDKLNLTKKITKEAASRFGPPMIQNLMMKIEESGFAAAALFCSGFASAHTEEANEKMAEDFKKTYGTKTFFIGRTSLKLRNPKNAPDETEKNILNAWEENTPKEPAFAYKNGTYYGMVPIKVVSDKCLGCHGDDQTRDKEAYDKIKVLYPDDQAIGYKTGDLRGAIRVRLTF